MKHKDMALLMGKVVVVEKTLYRVISQRMVSWVTSDVKPPRPGWVVGYRWLQIGKRISGQTMGWDNEWDPGYLKQTEKPILSMLVTYWPTMLPEKVPMGGCRLAKEGEEPYFASYRWDEKAKRDWSKEIRTWAKRDERGRFVKI